MSRFAGSDYQPMRDDARLTGQLLRIWDVVKDQAWHTLPEIARRAQAPEASVSAQLRHLRKPRFGAHTVEKEHVNHGLFRYRVQINNAALVR